MYSKQLSARTKRRRVQADIDFIYNQPSCSKSSSESSNKSIELNDDVLGNVEYLPELGRSIILNNSEPYVRFTNISNSHFSSNDGVRLEKNINDRNNIADCTLTKKLANWAVNYNVPLYTVSSLLGVLKPYEGIRMPFIPKDGRALLNTINISSSQFENEDINVQLDSSHSNVSSMLNGDNRKLIEPKQTMSAPVVDVINNKDNAAITTILETQSKMLRIVLDMKHSIHDLSLKLNIIENNQMEIYNNSKNNMMPVSNVSELTAYNFPIKTEEELQDFELKLTELPFKLRLVNELTILARDTIGNTLRRIMSKLFHNTLLSTYSYLGKNKKNPFQRLNANKVIFESIRKIKKFEKATDFEIEIPIKKYLAGAKFREQTKKNSI
ncbi:uncharacterized protein LOC100570789 [Acyrthosiphon pisum]|uniref:DUF4806 domain-containing protein n=1 Tax=Acyrthosiphon pisum TaxID=7029 RepID=A0A8R2D429_ACYPI|nr:uncharacterized protein LOC100570789 [Acyrthosiphon pisum]|eukprot:XP_016658634.1 PREDICTED: uncharacterized protein LOC100570789 [Acyrthosiphon pisum]